MQDIERLLNAVFPFVDDLLVKYGEFYPVGAALKIDNTVAHIGTYDGDDHPISSDVISGLKAGLRSQEKQYKAFVIFYDVKVTAPNTKAKSDAVAVLVEHIDSDEAWTFYYAYKLNNSKLEYSESWKERKEKEIFSNRTQTSRN
jgi:hypothetical protein